MESRISSLELMAEQMSQMMQDMMKMMEKFMKTEDNANRGQQQSKEVAMMTDQYKAKSPHGEEPEWPQLWTQ